MLKDASRTSRTSRTLLLLKDGSRPSHMILTDTLDLHGHTRSERRKPRNVDPNVKSRSNVRVCNTGTQTPRGPGDLDEFRFSEHNGAG